MKNSFFFFTLILTMLFALSTHAAKRQNTTLTVNGVRRWGTFHKRKQLISTIMTGNKLLYRMPSMKMKPLNCPSANTPTLLCGIASISG